MHIYIFYYRRKSFDLDFNYYSKVLSRRNLLLPKVKVEVESIMDVPGDGYRWRKYEHNSIKGNLMPRYSHLFLFFSDLVYVQVLFLKMLVHMKYDICYKCIVT